MPRTTRPARAPWPRTEEIGGRDVTLVFGAMPDKDVRRILSRCSGVRVLVCTTVATPRACRRRAGGGGAESWRGRVIVEAVDDPAAALARAGRRDGPLSGRLDLSGRPPAWYSSLIPLGSARTPCSRQLHSRHCVAFLLRCSALPPPRRRRSRSRQLQRPPALESERRPVPGKERQGARRTATRRPMTARAGARVCEDMHLESRSRWKVFERPSVGATGTCCSSRPPTALPPIGWSSTPRTRTGMFYNAAGTVTLRENRGRRQTVRHAGTGAMFRGEEIHKLGPDTYKIVKRPLHDLRAADPALGDGRRSVTLKLDDHALLKNAVLRVKGRAGDVPRRSSTTLSRRTTARAGS